MLTHSYLVISARVCLGPTIWREVNHPSLPGTKAVQGARTSSAETSTVGQIGISWSLMWYIRGHRIPSLSPRNLSTSLCLTTLEARKEELGSLKVRERKGSELVYCTSVAIIINYNNTYY